MLVGVLRLDGAAKSRGPEARAGRLFQHVHVHLHPGKVMFAIFTISVLDIYESYDIYDTFGTFTSQFCDIYYVYHAVFDIHYTIDIY